MNQSVRKPHSPSETSRDEIAEKPAPTKKQYEVLLFIAQHIRDHHTSPTIQTMAESFGVHRNAIQARLAALARKGLVRLPGKGGHGIYIVDATVVVALPVELYPRTTTR